MKILQMDYLIKTSPVPLRIICLTNEAESNLKLHFKLMTGKWKQKFWICWLKQYSQPESREFFYLVEMFNTLSPGDRFPVALKKNCAKEAGGKVRLYTSLQQREQSVWISKIRYQVKEFSILSMGRCKPLGLLKSFLSYVPQLSEANTVSLDPLNHSFRSSHSLKARNCWWLWHFLFIDMAGDIFIS